MEITGKVLREVEFRDRLRGYDTDEVDEFLEEVAVAVDELHRRLAQQGNRTEQQPEAKTRPSEPEPSIDDDAIRRTLVLAQRTADLAIREATEEANSILENARRESQEMVAQAEEAARRVRRDADEDFAARVTAQLAQREQLENDVRTLGALVAEERSRLSDSLQTVLRYVTDNLFLAPEVTAVASTPATVAAPQAPAREPEGMFFSAKNDDALDEDDPDAFEAAPLAFTEPLPVVAAPVEDQTDPDEELWKRWSQSDGFEEEDASDDADPFGFNRRP